MVPIDLVHLKERLLTDPLDLLGRLTVSPLDHPGTVLYGSNQPDKRASENPCPRDGQQNPETEWPSEEKPFRTEGRHHRPEGEQSRRIQDHHPHAEFPKAERSIAGIAPDGHDNHPEQGERDDDHRRWRIRQRWKRIGEKER